MMTEDQVREIVHSAGEAASIDFKGPMEWDGAIVSAKLSKDIVASANVRGGGVLVIGVREPETGVFHKCGLTSEQASSFDTTKMASWINSRFEPEIHLSCYRTEVDGNEFVVIDVDEFHEIPLICTKNWRAPNEKRNEIEAGRIYVRTANAESAPLRKASDLRRLVSIAALKKQEEMVTALRSVIEGVPRHPPTLTNRFESDRRELQTALSGLLGKYVDDGSWSTELTPREFDAARWQPSELAEALEGAAWTARLAVRDPRVYGRGVAMGTATRVIGVTLSGLVIACESFSEDRRAFENPYLGETGIEQGRWLGFFHSIWRAVGQFHAIATLVENYPAGTAFTLAASAIGIKRRRLVSESAAASLSRFDNESIASDFSWRQSVSREELTSDWETLCAKAVASLTQRFYHEGVQAHVIKQWIESRH